MGGTPRIHADVEPLREKATVKAFLNGLREGPGRRTSLYSLARYLRWRKDRGLEPDPDKLISACRNGRQNVSISHLEALMEYAQGLTECAGTTKIRNYKTVRGFYEANLITLPRKKLKPSEASNMKGSRTFAVKAETTAEDFLRMTRKALNYAGVRDKSIILTMLQGGLDASTLTEVYNLIAFPQLAKHFGTENWREWDVGLCPVRVDLLRPKSQYRFYTFQDIDAVEALKEYLDVRTFEPGQLRVYPPDDPSDLPVSDPIYLNGNGLPLRPGTVTELFREIGKRAGVNRSNGHKSGQFKGARIRYPWHSHEVRDTMTTIARGKVDLAIPRFLTAHAIDRLQYDKSPWNDPDHFRSEYLKISRPALNPISGRALEVERRVTSRFEERLARIEKEIADRLSALPIAP